ncbi:MAG TPA: sterol-binding protein [Burkholderiales bacterium]|nr:sterol-binding protein [Burkholderiales bacterium]
MFETLTFPAINRLLRANAWALEKLRPHAGKTVLMTCPPARVAATITLEGDLAPAIPEAVADVTIALTPGVLMRFAARDETAWREARVTGDVELAAAVDYVRRNLTWDYEEALSRVFGDVAAHRMASAARGLDAFARGTLLNLAHAAAEYATYENPVLASTNELQRFSREVDAIRDDVARLEKRIQRLSRTLA